MILKKINENLKIWQRIILSILCMFLVVGFFFYGCTYDLDAYVSTSSYHTGLIFPYPLGLSALFLLIHIILWKEHFNRLNQKKWKLWLTFIILTYISFCFFFYLEVFFWLTIIKGMNLETILSRL